MSVQLLCPLFIWVVFSLLSCRRSLYNLDKKPLSDICFVGIFSHSLGCLFTLLIMSFDVYKFLILMKSNLPIFPFANCALGVISFKRSLSNPTYKAFPFSFLLRVLELRLLHSTATSFLRTAFVEGKVLHIDLFKNIQAHNLPGMFLCTKIKD